MPTRRTDRPIRAAAKAPAAPPAPLTIEAAVTIDLEAKPSADGAPAMPRFTMVANTGKVPMRLEGWRYPVVMDFAGLSIPSQSRPIRLQHDPLQGVGHTERIAIEGGNLVASGVISRDTPAARDVAASGKNGFPWQASVGARADEVEFVAEGKAVTVNDTQFSGPVNVARKSTLGEISFVDLGADDQTSATVAASSPAPPASTKGAPTVFEQWLQAKGFDPAALTDDQTKNLRAMYDAEQKQPREKSPPAEQFGQIVKAAQEEQERQAEITRVFKAAIDERPMMLDEFRVMADAAMANKAITVTMFELEVLRASRARVGPAIHARGADPKAGPKMIEAAVCIAGRLDGIEKKFDQQTLNAAYDRFPNGLGLRDLLAIAARENGYSAPTTRDVAGLLRAAFPRTHADDGRQIRAEGFSTISLPGILSNIANKFLLASFQAVEDSWRMIASTRGVNDFKTITSYSLTGDLTYEKLGPAGEIKHGTVGELSYTNAADTYAKTLAVTRKDIINDDLGALTAVPKKLGRGAALKINDVFWTAFLAGVGVTWTSGNANLISGATTNLSSTSLATALKTFRKQIDPDSKPIAVTPRLLLIPPELEITADELMTSTAINTGGSSSTDKVPNRNVWVNKFTPVMSTYLSNTAYTGYSLTAWWLLADPNDLSTIEICFLNGREMPVVETAEADFDTLGIQMRGYHDFGVAIQEYRASVRSAGA